jgi:hypothetical protein
MVSTSTLLLLAVLLNTDLSSDPGRIAHGLLLDSPVSSETIDRSLEILEGLRKRYDLHGGVRDDEEAARRALAEIEAIEFSAEQTRAMAKKLGVSLDPKVCGEACENFERLVLIELRIEALAKLAGLSTPMEKVYKQR